MVIFLVNDTVCAWADWKLCIDFFNVNLFSLINSLCCHGNDCKLKFSRNRVYRRGALLCKLVLCRFVVN